MKYFKVKPSSDQTRHTIRYKRFDILVKDELYTAHEIQKAIGRGAITVEFVNTHFIERDIKPVNTFWFCGARFETTNDYSQKPAN